MPSGPVSVIRQQYGPVFRFLGFDLKKTGLDQSPLPALVTIIQDEFFFTNAKGNVASQPTLAKPVGDMKVVPGTFQRLLKDLAAGVGRNCSPAFSSDALIGLVAYSDVHQIN